MDSGRLPRTILLTLLFSLAMPFAVGGCQSQASSGPDDVLPADTADTGDPGAEDLADSREVLSEDLAESRDAPNEVAEDSSAGCGCLMVNLTFDGPLPSASLTAFTVEVLRDSVDCSGLQNGESASPQDVVASSATASLFAPGRFDCLEPESPVIVHALGFRKESPCPVASGCVDGVWLHANQCVNWDADLSAVKLDPSGHYSFQEKVDFSNVLTGCDASDGEAACSQPPGDLAASLCCLRFRLLTLFGTSPEAMVDGLDAAAASLGGIWSSVDAGRMSEIRAGFLVVLDSTLRAHPPPWLADLAAGLDDLGRIASGVELDSTVSLEAFLPASAGGNLQAHRDWHELALSWKRGCDPAMPDFDSCGRFPFGPMQLKFSAFPIVLASPDSVAALVDFDKLLFQPQILPIDLGRIVLLALQEVVFRTVSSGAAHTVDELARYWIDCDSISAQVFPTLSSGFVGTRNDIEALCNARIAEMVQPANAAILAMDIPSRPNLTEEIGVRDDNCDRVIDGGSSIFLEGTMESGAPPEASVTGSGSMSRMQ